MRNRTIDVESGGGTGHRLHRSPAAERNGWLNGAEGPKGSRRLPDENQHLYLQPAPGLRSILILDP